MKKEKGQIAQASRLAKKNLEQFNKDMPEEFELNAKDLLKMAMIWAVVGVVLVNTNFPSIPWLHPLGWVAMMLGLIAMAVSILASMGKK